LNQIVFAATSESELFKLKYVLLSESYFYVEKAALNTSLKVDTYSDYVNPNNTFYSSSLLNSVTQIFTNVLSNLKNYSIEKSNNNGKLLAPEAYLNRPAKIYKYGPFANGRINYINLSTVVIYTVSVSTTIIDNIDITQKDNIVLSDSNFRQNPYYMLNDTIYVSGGKTSSLGTLDYIGDAYGPNNVNVVYPYNYNSQLFNKMYYHRESETGTSYELYDKDNNGNYNYSSYGDMTFAEDSIILWGGLNLYYSQSISPSETNQYSPYFVKMAQTINRTTAVQNDRKYVSILDRSGNEYYYIEVSSGLYYVYSSDCKTVYIGSLENAGSNITFESFKFSKAYTFAGWYSQSYNENTGIWSELNCMSTDLYMPFVSTATTDTNIVALFTEVTKLEISYNPNEVSVEFDLLIDSCMKPILEVPNSDGTKTISGWFYYNSAPNILVSPVGGYRLSDDFNLSYTIMDDGTVKFIGNANNSQYYYKDLKDLENNFLDFVYYDINNKNYKSVSFSELSLSNIFYINLNLEKLMRTVNSSNALSSIKIDLNMTKYVLTHFTINGYTESSGTDSVENLYDVVLYTYKLNGSSYVIDEILFYSDGIKDDKLQKKVHVQVGNKTYTVTGRDSAHNEIFASILFPDNSLTK